MTIIELKISDLILDKRNPRKITKDAMEKLCQSLIDDPQYLQKRPVLVNHIDQQYQVYAGNQRIRAAKKLKWKTIPCIVDENLSEEILSNRVIKDNKQYGEWDYDMLADLYEVEDLIAAGFKPSELDMAEIEDIASDKVEETDSKCKMCPHCGLNL